MQRIVLIFLLIISSARASSVVEFKVSKPYCLFHFLEAATRLKRAPEGYSNQIDQATQGDENFNAICKRFGAIQLDYVSRREEVPVSRKQYRSTYDLICIALVNATSIDDFKQKAIGILPNEELIALLQSLKEAEPYYNRIVWDQNQKSIHNKIQRFQKYTDKVSLVFTQIKGFYNAIWPDNTPFNVALVPIPGKTSGTSATPHANSLCVSFLTDVNDDAGILGVVIHEICHVLYEEQPVNLQHQMDEVFQNNDSSYAKFANYFFDEGLATAIGNGWAYEQLLGKLDNGEWYNNTFINGFGHELYPLVKQYIDQKKVIDNSFIHQAITLFGKRFPDADTNYGILFNDVNVFFDSEERTYRQQLSGQLQEYFRINKSNFSSPILHEYSVDYMKNTSKFQVIVLDVNHEVNWKGLQALFPEIGALQPEMNSVYCFINQKRPVMIFYTEKENFPTLLKKVAEQKNFDKSKIKQF